MKTYYFGIPGLYIHLQHILIGLYLIYIGYLQVTNKKYKDIHDKILLYLGLIVLLYFIYLTIKLWKVDFNYSLNVPKNLVYLLHIVNGIAFILIGSGKLNKYSEQNGLYLIIMGTLSLFYHAHLMLMGNHKH